MSTVNNCSLEITKKALFWIDQPMYGSINRLTNQTTYQGLESCALDKKKSCYK